MAGTEGLNPFGVKDQKVTYSPSLGKTRETLHTQREVHWEPKREDTMPKYIMLGPSSPRTLGWNPSWVKGVHTCQGGS